MAQAAAGKLHSRRGLSLLAAILLVLVVVMCVLVSIPLVRRYTRQADTFGCAAAMDSATRQIAIDYLAQEQNPTPERVRQVVERAMRDVDALCPAGGEVYVVSNPNGQPPFALVCGLHGSDARQNTRLNAQRVLERLNAALLQARRDGDELPRTLTVTLHGEVLTAQLVTEEVPLKRGTATTSGYEGTVVFYGIAGHGEVGMGTTADDGEICYLAFADETHCALWTAGQPWSGDSYR